MSRLFQLLLITIHGLAMASDVTSSVRGKVVTAYREPLHGATVALIGETSLFSSADADGYFVFENVKPGRYSLKVSHTSYKVYETEILVITGKQNFILVELEESATVLDGLVIKGDSSLSGRPGEVSITIEKTMRVPANFFDPVRMITSYPGVVATNDQSNSISVKGFSPNALLWRLQGLDIVNPNHLANAGTFSDKPAANGGGVNVLSAQLLDRTDFYSGNFPVQYGNALSGAINMSLRAGDREKPHYTVQASLIGMDVAAEAPVIKGRSSILANYRYSTVGLLSNLGVNFGGEQINFQDFSFHYDHDQKKNRRLSIFGFGGLSFNRFNRKPQDEWKEEKDRYNIDFDGKVFGVGLTEEIPMSSKALVKFGTAFSGQFQERYSESAPVALAHLASSNYQNNKTIFSSFVSTNFKINTAFKTEVGAYLTRIDQQALNDEVRISFSSGAPINNYRLTIQSWLWQPYASVNLQISPHLSLDGGLRLLHVGKSFMEPRAALSYRSSIGSFQLSSGVTHQYQPQVGLPDKEDHVMQSTQTILNYQNRWPGNISVNSSLYYFQQQDVPINVARNFSTLNALEETLTEPLTGNGKGRNYGWDVFVEKKFRNLSYINGGFSLYRAEYRIDQDYLPSRFDGRFTATAIAGKEWSRKKNVLGVNVRAFYLGGFREQSIDAFQSLLSGTTYFNFADGFSQQLPNYFRTDLRLSWRKNKPRHTRTVSIDIQNLTAQKNVAYRYYDTFLQSVQTKYQLSLIPVLVYRVDF